MHVRVDVQQKYQGRIRGLHLVRDLLKDSGVTLDFEQEGNCDLLFIHDLLAVENRKTLPPVPMIVFERFASSVVSPFRRTRRLLRKPQVKFWVKEMTARFPELHNAKMINGRYHFALLEPDNPLSQDPAILMTDDQKKKVMPFLPMFLQERYNDLRDGPLPDWRDRSIDLFCAGYLHDDFEILGRHRRRALRLVESSNRNYISISGKLITQSMYYEILRNTKIFVSPYGLGEYSFKDFEALYAGCLLVKPDSSFCVCHSLDIFGGGYCVQTKPDMSDFPEVLDEIFDNLKDYRDMAGRAAQDLRHAFKPEDYAREVLKVFNSALES